MLTTTQFCKNCIKSKRDCAGYVHPLVYKEHHHGPHSAVDRPSIGDKDQFQFNASLDLHAPQQAFFNPFGYAGYHDDPHARHGSLSASQGYQYPPPDAGPYVLESPMALAAGYRRHSMHHAPSSHTYGLGDLQTNVPRGDPSWSARSQQSSISDSTPFSYGDPQSNLTSPYELYPQPRGSAPGYFPYDANQLHGWCAPFDAIQSN